MADRYTTDVFLRHQVLLERLKAGLVQDSAKAIAEVARVIAAELAHVPGAFADLSPAEVEELIRRAVYGGAAKLSPWQDALVVDLRKVAGHEADFNSAALVEVGAAVAPHAVSALQAWQYAVEHPVQATGKLLEPMVREWSASTLEAVETTIRTAHAQGWTVQDTVRAIKGTKAKGYADGIANNMRRSVEALVRTSVQHVSNTAREATFEANADIVVGVTWISTLDSRTCATCRSLDHRDFELAKGPRPPVHVSCRCSTIPRQSGVEPAGTRASKGAAGGAQVPAGETYYSWLKQQPASFQDAAIGKTRGKLLRNGGLSADDFARLSLDKNFQPLTLDEMRALRPEAFKRAGL